MSPTDGNDWMEYRQFVIKKLDELAHGQDELASQLVLVRIDLAMLKVRASLWGAAAGMVPAVVGVLAILVGGGP